MQNMMQRIRNRKGFTLVELMIVVAIIGILAAIAIPAFLRAVKKSKTSEADGNVKKMVDGAKAYFTSEQKNSKGLAAGGGEPWHDDATKVGYPVPWAEYAFPGGELAAGFTSFATGQSPEVTIAPNATSAGDVTVTNTCANAPTGGSKLQPFGGVQPLTTEIESVLLNKLNVTFTDPTYFEYQYHQTGLGQNASAVVAARANFKVDGDCHTIYQAVVVDDVSQEVQIVPSVVQFEFE